MDGVEIHLPIANIDDTATNNTRSRRLRPPQTHPLRTQRPRRDAGLRLRGRRAGGR